MNGGRLIALLSVLDACALLKFGTVGRTQLVKIVYLVETLRPVYASWTRAYDFVKYRYGPYSERIGHDLDLLLMHGLVTATSFERTGRRVRARYEITRIGSESIRVQDRTEVTIVRSLAVDVVWCLQGLGIETAREICDLVYCEPSFAAELARMGTEPGSPDQAPRLRSSFDPTHESFQLQSVLAEFGRRQSAEHWSRPRDLTRAYFVALGRTGARKHAASREAE